MTPKQWAKFLETGEAQDGDEMYYPRVAPDLQRGGRWAKLYWYQAYFERNRPHRSPILCRTAKEADELAGVMLAAAREWREKR
jgi:hypothetical protein